MLRTCLLLFTLIVSACGSGKSIRNTQEVQFDKYRVQWSELSFEPAPIPDQMTPLFFRFTEISPPNSPKTITEADFKREAETQGVSLENLKQMLAHNIRNGELYKTNKGRIAICTYFAKQEGLCGRKLGLSIEQRTNYARRAIEMSDNCQWSHFDPLYNLIASRSFGAEDNTLHVPARCR